MIWTIICFLVVLFVLKRYAFGPIQQMIDTRRERIQQAIAEADNARDEARNLLEEHRKLIGQAKSRVGGDPRRGTAPRRRAARPGQAGDRGGPPAAARGDAPPDRAGDRAGARRDPRRGRKALAPRGREDHAQVAHRRRPAAADRRGARRDRLLGPRREPVVAIAHRIYARALVRGGAGARDARGRAGAARAAPRRRDLGRRAPAHAREPRGRLAGEGGRPRSGSPQGADESVVNFVKLLAEKGRAAELGEVVGRIRRARRGGAAHPRRPADDRARAVRHRSSRRFSAASSRPRAARCKPNGTLTQT